MTPAGQPIYANPFTAWAELAAGLRERFIRETGMNPEKARTRPRAVELLNAINAIKRQCDAAGNMLDRLEDQEPDSFQAFHRALEMK